MENYPSGLRGFFKKGASPGVPAVKPSAELHRTLGLKEFLVRLDGKVQAGKGKVNLLDLGPAVEENILYLGSRGCKVYVQDFFFELEQARRRTPTDQEFSFNQFLDLTFPYPNGTFDAVLGWDLFNYLGSKDGNALADKLFTQMKVGGLLLAFFSSAKTIPHQPIGYRIVDASNLTYESNSVDQMNAPGFTNNQIAKIMGRFAVVNFYFLRNGVREALMARK